MTSHVVRGVIASMGDATDHDSNPCMLCGSTKRVVEAEGDDYEYASKPGPFRMVRCTDCKHVYIDPMPTEAELGELYPPTYATLNPDTPLFDRGPRYDNHVARDAKWLLSTCDVPIRSVLEVGCGDAKYLCAIKRALGPDSSVTGVDIQFNDEVRAEADRSSVRLIEGTIEHAAEQLATERFDLVYLLRNIEHLRDPLSTLRWAKTKLTPGGRFLMLTPNMAGLDYRLFRKTYWGGYHFPRHLHLFSMESLRRLAKLADFDVAAHACRPSPVLWTISLRNALGLSSAQKGRSMFEFLKLSNIAATLPLVLLDLATLRLGFETSNQYIVLRAPDGAPPKSHAS